ncbi:MAG: hypothetical protein ABSE95_02255 [Thermodesulfobacteriota bacterium]
MPEFFRSFAVQVVDEYPVGLFHHLTYSLYQGVGLGILLSTGLGLTLLLKNSPTWPKIIFIAGTVIWYGVNTFFTQKYMRYTIPLLPFVYIFAAVGLLFILNLRSRSLKITFLSLFILLFAFQSYKTVKADYLSRQLDNRDVAREWIEQNLPENAAIALSDWGPPLIQSEAQIQEKINNIEKLQVVNRRKQKQQLNQYKNKRLLVLLKKAQASPKTFRVYMLYDKKTDPLLSKPEIIPYDWNEIQKRHVEYLALTLSYPEEGNPGFWRKVKNRTQLLKIISPYNNNKVGGRYDPYENTAGSIETREVINRVRYGDMIGVYKIIL